MRTEGPPAAGAAVEGGQRLHPLSPLFEIGRSFLAIVVPGLFVLLLATDDAEEAWYMLAFLPAVVLSLKRWLTLRYELLSDHLVIREGLFFRTVRHVPYARIQNVDTVQTPLHRLFGVVEVRLETAGGQAPEAVLRVLSVERFEALREGVGARRSSAAGEAAPAPEAHAGRAFFRMSPEDLTLFGLFSQRGIALLGGLLFLVWEFDLWERLQRRLPADPAALSGALSVWHWTALALAALLVLQGLTVLWGWVVLHGFAIERSGEVLRTTCGLWTRQSASLPRHRVQFLSVRETWPQRKLARLSVKVVTAGGDSTGESQISRKWLVPLAEREALGRILAEVQPELTFEGVRWRPVHPRAWRRMFARWSLFSLIPLAFVAYRAGVWAVPAGLAFALVALFVARARARRLGWELTESAILVRDGVWTHVRNAVRYAKIQSISLVQTPFDRRHRMASLRVDTAGGAAGQLSLEVPYLDLRVARRLARRLQRTAAREAFRW